nr:sugar-binding domain-containing protein [uncultured Carboxylicivirga sp.]
MKNKLTVFCIIAASLMGVVFSSCNSSKRTDAIDLKGEWVVKLDPNDEGESGQWFNHPVKDGLPITLPSTLDEAAIGKKSEAKATLDKETLYQLTRKYSYIGAAWYQKEIQVPANLADKEMVLKMERVIWKSQVWIDGTYKGTDNSLVTAHEINLGKLSEGKHLVTICIDNRQQYDLFDNAQERSLTHSYTETTQTIWNGVLGDFEIVAMEAYSVNNLQVYPDVASKSISIKAKGDNTAANSEKITVEVLDCNGKVIESKKLAEQEDISIEIKHDFELWDEHNPVLYSVKIKNTAGIVLAQTKFGMRQLESVENNLMLNGKRLFLRGTLECNIFPLLGHPPLDEHDWLKVFATAKSYGLNHLRFHSWCPPQAAFNVADSLGFYLQVEMPNWSLKYGTEPDMVKWMENEGRRMIRNYGNHPSFCMMALGNELEGDYELLANFVRELKSTDQRHLYTITAFTFQKPYTSEPDEVDQFWITQWTKDGWVRGQGVFDEYPPSFDKDYRSSIEFLDIPLITHEIGQYSVYPNLKEISKYTGVLEPLNFEAIRNDLKAKGRLDKAEDYLLASGHLAKILYKEEVERALKTPGISGFQLLDLHDFPGQGTALVGMLDAFWDSKGIVTGQEFKQFCSELVPLLKFEKAVYTNDEVFAATAEVANYWKTLDNAVFDWTISKGGEQLKAGELKVANINQGSYQSLGDFNFDLKDVAEPSKLDITLSLKGTDYKNNWSVWVYPTNQKVNAEGVVVTTNWKEAEKALAEGGKVLFTPALEEVEGIEGKFVPVFWSPVHFPNQPGSMGLLIDNKNAAFKSFPTEYYTNWQWWDLCKKSKSLNVEDVNAKPIVTVVDNFFKNRDLSNLFEAKVGKGTLVFSGIDLNSDLNNRITAKALLNSILNYMRSPEFKPENKVTFDQLKSQFQRDANQKDKEKKSIYDN